MGKRNKTIIYTWVAVISLGIFLYAGANLLGYYMDHRNEMALEEEFDNLRGEASQEAVSAEVGASVEGTEVSQGLKKERTPEEIAAFYDQMKQKNPDYVCWIFVPGTDIDYPVLKRDNAFYLNHDYKGQSNRHGSIFLDENCEADGDMFLVHGHHMKDGTMFGSLKQYKNDEWRKDHREIVLEFADGQRKYRVFAAALVDLTAEEFFAFERIPETDNAKAIYIEGLEEAAFWFDEDAEVEGASVLVLSTCEYGSDDQRLLVAAFRTE